MSDRSNLYLYQNTDFRTPLYFYDEDGPIDISIYEFYAQIRKLYSSAVIADFEFISTEEPGSVEIFLSKDITSTLTPGKYQYDILVKDISGGVVTKVLEGLLVIMDTITKIEHQENDD